MAGFKLGLPLCYVISRHGLIADGMTHDEYFLAPGSDLVSIQNGSELGSSSSADGFVTSVVRTFTPAWLKRAPYNAISSFSGGNQICGGASMINHPLFLK
jgi:hypothetical protein